MENITENPWNVENLEEFLYFCCPECNLKDPSKMNFLQHALEQHPKAKECAKLHNFIVKDEPYDEISYNLEKEYGDILKCEVKIENKDQNSSSILEEKPHNCEFCEKSFVHTTSLIAHLKIVHKNYRDNIEVSSENKEYILNRKFDDDFVIEEHKNISGIGRCKPSLLHENEILVNLVKQYGLTEMAKYDSERNAVWIQITEEFNERTGHNWNIKKVKMRWKNYKAALKKSNNNAIVTVEDNVFEEKSSEAVAEDDFVIQTHQNISANETGESFQINGTT